MRRIVVTALACWLSACSPQSARNTRPRADDPSILWYRVKVATSYRGRPVAFDQLVACHLRTVPGGPFGSTPAVTERKMHPMTTGLLIADGSFLAVRLPDLCRFNRTDRPLPRWREAGPFAFAPLMVWSNRIALPTLTEVFVGDSYYEQPDARITRPTGEATFLPAGTRPANAAAVLAQGNVVEDNSALYGLGESAMTASVAEPISDPRLDLMMKGLFTEARDQEPHERYVPYGFIQEKMARPPRPLADFVSGDDTATCERARQGGYPDGPRFLADSASRARYLPDCRTLLSEVAPFVWTGKRFEADTKRRGVLIFQRSSAAMQGASYVMDGQVVPAWSWVRNRRSDRWYKLNVASGPVVDPDGGE